MAVKAVAASTLPDIYLDSDAGQAYALNNSSVGQIVLRGSYAPFIPHLAPATMSVQGHSSITGMSDGWLRAAPVSLVVTIAPGASLTNTGKIGVYNNGSLIINGGAQSKLTNNGSIDTWGSNTTMKFGADIKGTGTIVDGNNGYGQVGTKIEFGGAVGSGQKITLDSGTLQLDKPMQFHAVIDHLNATAPNIFNYPALSMIDGTIVLEHTHATRAMLTASELVLKEGNVTVADLHFSSLANIGASGVFLTSEKDGSTVVSGFSLPGSHAVHVGTMPTLLS